jgi:hypothetical protein
MHTRFSLLPSLPRLVCPALLTSHVLQEKAPDMPPHAQVLNIYGIHVVIAAATELLLKLRPDTGLQSRFLKHRPTPQTYFTISATELFLAFATALFAMKFYYQYVSVVEISET